MKKFRKKFKKFIRKLMPAIEYKYNKEYINYLKEYNKNDSNKQIIFGKLLNIFKDICRKMNSLIYSLIIKRLICEKIQLTKQQRADNMAEIEENIEYSASFELKKKRKRNRDKWIKKFKILWITEFYSKEKIKNNIDKNTYISVASDNYIIIYLFNFLLDLININKEKKKIKYEIIKKEIIDIIQPEKIIRLEKIFQTNQEEDNNYFLISSILNNKAIIINITENYQKIDTIQKINFYKGLISAIEFQYNEDTFLFDSTKEINLWYLDKEANKLENKEITPNYEKLDREYSTISKKTIIYVEKKKLFIIQAFSPKILIEFYLIDNKIKEFNLILIGRISLKEEENKISYSYNNYCIIKDKYLLMGSERNKKKNKNDGGIYIINLDNFQLIQYYKFTNCNAVIDLITLNNNLFLCTLQQYIEDYKRKIMGNNNIIKENNNINVNNKNNFINYRKELILLELNEEKFSLEIKNRLFGEYYSISCSNIISNSFLLCTHKGNNSIIKINENGELSNYFKIDSL